jgi:hypothetical protein
MQPIKLGISEVSPGESGEQKAARILEGDPENRGEKDQLTGFSAKP